jgi:hypothetical protein
MPDKKPGETKKSYLERCVPKLIREGKDPKQAVAICNSMYAKAEADAELPVCREATVEFESEISYERGGFLLVSHEDLEATIEFISFESMFKMLGFKESQKYEVEICIEECDD